MYDIEDRDLLRSVAQHTPDVQPDYHQLIMNGMVRGRRRRLIRRVVQGMAGTGLAAAVGVTAFAVTSFPSTTPGISVAPAGGPTSAAKPAPGRSTVIKDPANGQRQELLPTLESMLPADGKVSHRDDGGDGWATLRYADAHGVAFMSVTVYAADKGEGWQCPTAGQLPDESCSVTDTAKGRLFLAEMHQYPGKADSAIEATAALQRNDATVVSLTQINRIGEKEGGITRDGVPLSRQQVKVIVSSPHWQPVSADGGTKQPLSENEFEAERKAGAEKSAEAQKSLKAERVEAERAEAEEKPSNSPKSPALGKR